MGFLKVGMTLVMENAEGLSFLRVVEEPQIWIQALPLTHIIAVQARKDASHQITYATTLCYAYQVNKILAQAILISPENIVTAQKNIPSA